METISKVTAFIISFLIGWFFYEMSKRYFINKKDKKDQERIKRRYGDNE